MITRLEEIPVTKESYPFASAERYLKLSERGYVEKEYYMYGTANVYETADERGGVRVRTADAPYTNRIIVRAPQDTAKCSGNVVVEIINPTSFMEIDRMWILGWKKFVRDGDIYVGITSKPNTIAKMVEFDEKRYGCLSWANPTPDVPFSERLQVTGGLGDLNHDYETGLFWDMLTDLAWLLRGDEEQNPIREYKREYVYLTGWSQSGSYLFRYLNSFAYRPEVARGACVFNGYLSGGGVHSLGIPVNQYETMTPYHYSLTRVEKAREPFIAVQTESENGRMEAWRIAQQDSDDPEFLFRQYDVTGASHDTSYSYVNYYQNDPDLVRINHLPFYMGKMRKETTIRPRFFLRQHFGISLPGYGQAQLRRTVTGLRLTATEKTKRMRSEIRSVDCVPASLTIQPEDTAIPATLKKARISWIRNRKRKDCSVISRRFRKK